MKNEHWKRITTILDDYSIPYRFGKSYRLPQYLHITTRKKIECRIVKIKGTDKYLLENEDIDSKFSSIDVHLARFGAEIRLYNEIELSFLGIGKKELVHTGTIYVYSKTKNYRNVQ